MKTNKQKQSLLEQLKEMPIVHISCKKLNVSRASYYRWRQNKEFAKAADTAIAEGEALITDMSESQLVSLIRDRNFPAIQLWLKSHHSKYGNKVEVTGNLNIKEEPLSPEQKELVQQALGLAGLLENKLSQQKDD